jgi:hypothetical protein
MKNIFILFVFLSSFSLAQEKVNGPVKSVLVTKANSSVDKSGKENKEESLVVERSNYNRGGNLVFAKYYTGHGDDVLTNKYQYKGTQLIEEEFIDIHGLGYKAVYKYSKGHVTEEKWYTKDGKNNHKSVYIYDGSRLLRTEQFRGQKKYPSVVTIYDAQKNIIEMMFVTEYKGGMRFDYNRNRYDKKGRLVEATQDGTNGKSVKTTYVYNDENKSMKETMYKDGVIETKKKYYYNTDNDIIEEYTYNNNTHEAIRSLYKYVYNSDGLLARKTELRYRTYNEHTYSSKTVTEYLDFDKHKNYLQILETSNDSRGKTVVTTNMVINYYE